MPSEWSERPSPSSASGSPPEDAGADKLSAGGGPCTTSESYRRGNLSERVLSLTAAMRREEQQAFSRTIQSHVRDIVKQVKSRRGGSVGSDSVKGNDSLSLPPPFRELGEGADVRKKVCTRTR